MAKKQKNVLLVLLRISLGVIFLYAGLSKVMNPDWSAAGFLSHAESFQGFFGWFGTEANIGWVNFLNQWGQVCIGLGLITGTFTRLASYFGILLMVLYYLPDLDFPFIGEHGFLIDDHIIYALTLGMVAQLHAGKEFGLDAKLAKCCKWKNKWWF